MAKFKKKVAHYLERRNEIELPRQSGFRQMLTDEMAELTKADTRFVEKYIFSPFFHRTSLGTAALIGGQVKGLKLSLKQEDEAFENIASEHHRASEKFARIVDRLMLEYQKRYGETYPLEKVDKLVRAHQAPRVVMKEPAIAPEQALKLLAFLHANRQEILDGKTVSLPQGLEHHHAGVHEIMSASNKDERQRLLEDFAAQLGRQITLPRPALPEKTD